MWNAYYEERRRDPTFSWGNGTLPLELLLLASLTAGMLFWRLGERPLGDWDEALYAQVAREMVEGGDWLTLSWNHQPYFKKPPLLFWSIALSYRVFGITESAARFPGALFGLGSVLLVCLLGRQLHGRQTGLCAGVLLLTVYPFLTHGSRQSATDAPLLFFTLLALSCFWRGRHHAPWLAGVGIAVGAGLLTKGVAGLLPSLILLLFCAWAREGRVLRSRCFCLGLGGGVLLACPWYGYQVLTHGPAFTQTFLREETLARLLMTYDADVRSWPFYLETLWGDLFHCLPLVVGFPVLWLLQRRKRWCPLRAHQQLLLCWLVVAVLVVVGTQTRQAWYLLPVYPPLCILVAGMGSTLWDRLFRSAPLIRTPWLFLQQAAFVLTLCGFLFSLPGYLGELLPGLLWVEDYYQDRNALLQEFGAQLDSQVPLYALGPPMPGVVFYGRHATEFLSEAELVGSLSTRQTPAYVLVSSAFVAQMGEQGSSVLGQRGEWRLVTYLPVVQASSEDPVPGQEEARTDAL